MKTMLIVESNKGRDMLLRVAEEHLAEDEAIVRITDTISLDRSKLVVPRDPRAEVVAREPPLVLPGGVTALTSYVKLPIHSLQAVEHELEGTRLVSSREITLTPERVGRGKRATEPSA